MLLQVSEHTHHLSSLQLSLSRWSVAMASPTALYATKLRLARSMAANARMLNSHLRRRRAAGDLWGEGEKSDHTTCLPPALRFLHALLCDYHASFCGRVDVSLAVLREVRLCVSSCTPLLRAVAHAHVHVAARPHPCRHAFQQRLARTHPHI